MCLNLLLLDTGTSNNYTIIKFIFVKTASKTTEFKSYSSNCSIGQALLKKTWHHIHINSLHILVITLKAHFFHLFIIAQHDIYRHLEPFNAVVTFGGPKSVTIFSLRYVKGKNDTS